MFGIKSSATVEEVIQSFCSTAGILAPWYFGIQMEERKEDKKVVKWLNSDAKIKKYVTDSPLRLRVRHYPSAAEASLQKKSAYFGTSAKLGGEGSEKT